MAKILIIFGSKSDESVYNKISSILKNEEVHFEVRISSAHRTPDELEVILETDADVIIAGAGLAAHLPGVIASKIIKPIIGVPVESNYQGLDALLSIMQMPPGIPVLSTGVNKTDVAAKLAVKMLKEYKRINLFGDLSNLDIKKSVDKAIESLKEFGVKYQLNPDFTLSELNIKFITLDEKPDKNDELTIYVPVIEKTDDTAEAALNILKKSSDGLWVGIGRGENAALAAIEILNIHGGYTDKLIKHRKKNAEKVREHDKEVRKTK